MKLHADASGRGRPLVLLHGWGFHSGIWGGLAERLAHGRRLIRVDLPGHGHSAGRDFASLDGLVDEIAAVIPDDALVAGWSLGGLAALRLATRHRAKVRALALIASTPCFAARAGWDHGIAPAVLEDFARDLKADTRATLIRFALLNAVAASGSRDAIRALERSLAERAGPSRAALDAGLAVLASSDLRSDAAAIAVPALVIHGARDRIVPVGAGRWLAASLGGARLVELPAAAHLPFISEPEAVATAFEQFDA